MLLLHQFSQSSHVEVHVGIASCSSLAHMVLVCLVVYRFHVSRSISSNTRYMHIRSGQAEASRLPEASSECLVGDLESLVQSNIGKNNYLFEVEQSQSIVFCSHVAYRDFPHSSWLVVR